MAARKKTSSRSRTAKKAQNMATKKAPSKSSASAVEEIDEIEEIEEVVEEPAPPMATVEEAADPATNFNPKKKVAVAADSKDDLVVVRPRADLPRCSIGGTWYAFRKGQDVEVPKDVERLLRERDLI